MQPVPARGGADIASPNLSKITSRFVITAFLIGFGQWVEAGAPLSQDVVFVSKQFRGTSGRYEQTPFDNQPDVRSDLFKLTAGGELVQLTDLSEYDGGVLDPDISWDGTKILFSMRRHPWEGWHIWKMNVDGSGLRQVTFDPPGLRANDLDPIYLSEEGRFAFTSDRLAGTDEEGEGTASNLFVGDLATVEVRPIGFNPSGSAGPVLDNTGSLLINRWEHLRDNNRGAIWRCNQDGTGMTARWGQYGVPAGRQVAGYDLQQAPGDGTAQYIGVFTDFEDTAGDLGLFSMTDFIRDPEGNPNRFPRDGSYRSPSFIDAQTVLYSYDPWEDEAAREDYGLYLDTTSQDGRTLVYNATETHEIDPVLVRSRTAPPLTSGGLDLSSLTGLFVCDDVTLRGDCRQPCALTPGLGDPALDRHLALGVPAFVRVFKPAPRRADWLDVTLGGPDVEPMGDQTSVAGYVEVATDGSVAIDLPAGKPYSLQILDENGVALAHERSWLWAQPGETVSCMGCHVPRNNRPFPIRNEGVTPAALSNPVDISGTSQKPLTYISDIHPVFASKCIGCHAGAVPPGDLDLTIGRESYSDLLDIGFGRIPSAYIQTHSARNSFLYQLLVGDAFGQSDHMSRIAAINAGTDHTTMLSSEELTAIVEWIDTEPSFAFLASGLVEGPPEVEQTIPKHSIQGVPTNTPVEIRFNEAINPDQRLLFSFSLVRTGDDAPIAGTLTFPREDVLRFVPSAPLEGSTAYTISLATDVQDLEGNYLESPLTSQFTTGTTPDTGGPSVAWVAPGGELPLSGPIRIGFDEPMSMGSVRRDRFHLLDELGEEQPFLFSLNDNRNIVQLAPFPALSPDSFYTLIVDTSLADTSLNPLGIEHMTVFYTPAPPPPSALTLDADSYDVVSWNFDGQEILPSESGLWTYGLDWEESRLRWFWNGNRENLVTIELANRPISMVKSSDGNLAYIATRDSQRVQVVDLIHQFGVAEGEIPTDHAYQIALDPSGTRLRLTARDPDRIYTVDVDPSSPNYLQTVGEADLADHNRGWTWITLPNGTGKAYVTGNRGLDIFQLAANNVVHLERIAVNQHLMDSVSTLDGTLLYFINRSRGVVSVLDTAADRVIAEVALDFGAEWSWRRGEDRIALSPDERTLVVTQETTGRVWAIDRMTLAIIDFIDLGERITALSTWEGGSSGDWFIQVFVRDLYRDRSRWLTLRGPRGLDGVAPSLVSSDPADGESDVALNRTFTLNFSEEMDRHSLSTLTVQVACTSCPIPHVTVEVIVDDDNRTARLISEGTWPLDADLSVSLSTQVRDRSGQPLSAPVSFDFHTSATSAFPYVSLIADFSRVGGDATRMTVDPEGRWILTSDYYGDDVYIHDQTTFDPVDVIEVGDGPVEVFCPPGSDKAFITNRNEDTVSVLDLNTLADLGKIDVDGRPEQMALSRDGTTLHVVCAASDTIVNIDVATNQVVGRHSPPTGEDDLYSVATSANHDWLLGAWNRLFRFEGDATETHWVPNQSNARILRMAVSPDGYQLYYSQQYRGEIYMTDTVTWRWTDTIPVETQPSDILLSPEGRFLYLAHREEGVVRVIDRFTTETVDVIEVDGDCIDLAFSNDGGKLFVLTRGNPGRVLVYGIADPADSSAPYVVGVDPYDGARDVSANTVLRVEFSEAMDRVTLASNTLWVSGGTIDPGHGELVFSEDNRTAYFVGEIPFDLGTTYNLNVSGGLRDLSGNALLAPFTSTFSVAQTLNPGPATVFSASSGVTGTPYYITSMTDGGPVLVSNYYSNALSLHDPDTLVQGFSINRERRTGRAMPVDGNRAWVSYPEDGELALVNVTNGQVEDTITYQESRRDETISPDRSKLAIAMGGDPAFLEVADLTPTGAAATREYDIWDWPRALQFAPDNSYLYLSHWGNIAYLNLDSGVIERWISGSDLRQILLSPDGRTLYAIENNPTSAVSIDVETGRRLTALPIGVEGDWAMALSPNGSLLAVMNHGSDEVYFFDTLTNDLVSTYAPGVDLQAGTFSREGMKYYYTWDGESGDGVTALDLTNLRAEPAPSPTPTNTPVRVPTPTPTVGTEPTLMFDVVRDGYIDSKDLLMMIDDEMIPAGEPVLFEFSVHWRNGSRK